MTSKATPPAQSSVLWHSVQNLSNIAHWPALASWPVARLAEAGAAGLATAAAAGPAAAATAEPAARPARRAAAKPARMRESFTNSTPCERAPTGDAGGRLRGYAIPALPAHCVSLVDIDPRRT